MSERLAGAKGASRAGAGACYLCESGRERMVERTVKRCGRVCRSRGAFGGWVCWSLCMAEWGVGVRERVTRSAVGASDTGRWVWKCALWMKIYAVVWFINKSFRFIFVF